MLQSAEIVWSDAIPQVREDLGIRPDFRYGSPRDDTELDYIHRRAEKVDNHFAHNKKQHWETVQAHLGALIGELEQSGAH